MTKIEVAYMVAEKAHKYQCYGLHPYMFHIYNVVSIAESLGYDESIIIACILHDTIEDTTLSFNDIKKAFGKEIAEIVYCVTDELGRDRNERKSKTYKKIQENWKATVVKICDRIANVSQSKENNQVLYKMYVKEHETFCSRLMSAEHPYNETNKAWMRLGLLFNK